MRRIKHLCTTCERRLHVNAFPKLPADSDCKHERDTCRRCWHQWLDVQVKTKASNQISCAQCNNTLSQSAVRALATPAVYERYLDAELKAALSADPDFRWCLAPGCESGQVHTEGDIFCCTECGSKACVHCNVAWHEEETCEGYQARMQLQPKEEDKSTAALKKYAKLCPGCGRKFQKNGGCDHIRCTMCRHEFCYLCFADYKDIFGKGNHAHKSSCAHWRPAPVARPAAPPGRPSAARPAAMRPAPMNGALTRLAPSDAVRHTPAR
ncbi:hypothetical protein BDY17DRAFT_142033 [Neohortaea acidophila]|uniref:RBR-type E3 ubiquitin transferase n=1 Tax=Neohortaea acidophila TaxID=245834 RepID=A0A6A6PSR3_9PEZI|nr:uncharacterized protein BDY17DRAFT_142033 [Neohortaea acidophila]KAF2483140.1 hypothetical protein BDY17DRAFT_142033 [Neohortaea acidophila]